MKIAIMSGGTTEKEDEFYQQILPQYDFHIAVDMGMNVFWRLQKIPDVLIGDLDSVDPNIDLKGIEVHRFSCNKDKTDTELALDYCANKSFYNVDILGGIGDRLDHTFANVYLLHYAENLRIKLRIVNPQNTIYLLTETTPVIVDGKKGDLLSLIPVSDILQGVTIQGCRWDIENIDIARGRSHGVSNCLQKKSATISTVSGKAFIFHVKPSPE